MTDALLRIARITVQGERLRIEDWETAAPAITTFFKERIAEQGEAALPTVLEHVLMAGVAAVRAGGIAVNVDYVEKEFNRLASRLKEELDTTTSAIKQTTEKVFAEDGGVLIRALERYMGEGGKLSDLFDPQRKDSAIGRLQALLAEHFDGDASKLAQLLDVTNPHSPLCKWKESMDSGFKSLRELIESYRVDMEKRLAAQQARGEERERGTLKGRDYQSLVFEAINEFAKVFGDVTEPTGDLYGLGGDKVGDIVVVINPRDTSGVPLRAVFEAKDRPTTGVGISRELETAKKNRNAAVGVAVYSSSEYMPAGAAPFREDGALRYLCLYDKESSHERLALGLAYRIARYAAVETLQYAAGVLDVGGIRQDLREGRKLLAAFATLKGQVTQLKTAFDKGTGGLEVQIEELKSTLLKLFDRMDERLTSDRSAGPL